MPPSSPSPSAPDLPHPTKKKTHIQRLGQNGGRQSRTHDVFSGVRRRRPEEVDAGTASGEGQAEADQRGGGAARFFGGARHVAHGVANLRPPLHCAAQARIALALRSLDTSACGGMAAPGNRHAQSTHSV